MEAEELPLPEQLEVVASKPTLGASGPEEINYLVVAGPTGARSPEIARHLVAHLRADGWTIGKFNRKRRPKEPTAKSSDVFAVISPEGCKHGLHVAPPAAISAAADLKGRGRASVCVTLATAKGDS